MLEARKEYFYLTCWRRGSSCFFLGDRGFPCCKPSFYGSLLFDALRLRRVEEVFKKAWGSLLCCWFLAESTKRCLLQLISCALWSWGFEELEWHPRVSLRPRRWSLKLVVECPCRNLSIFSLKFENWESRSDSSRSMILSCFLLPPKLNTGALMTASSTPAVSSPKTCLSWSEYFEEFSNSTSICCLGSTEEVSSSSPFWLESWLVSPF